MFEHVYFANPASHVFGQIRSVPEVVDQIEQGDLITTARVLE